MTLDELEIKRLKQKCFYTRKEINEILKNISQKVVVDELPLTGIENYLYAIPTQNENEYNQYVWNNNLWESLGTTQDTLTDYVTQPELELELNKKKLYTEVTWQELKGLRDNSQLSPGSLYRITDYQCTTTQENTRSAGHQFDIVLLALSEDKLAEEGWAMEHPTDVYDVTFNDGAIVRKCYLYFVSDNEVNVVDVETLLGVRELDIRGEILIDKNSKTASIAPNVYHHDDMVNPDITYNYFQNSNLSAWKVWYCLDNDKSRFAWADNSVDESIEETITYRDYMVHTVPRNSSLDKVQDGTQYYGWGTGLYTKTLDIVIGETQVWNSVGTMVNVVEAHTLGHEGTGLPNGRGVIYRLIDEFNNDIKYDFKNIQFKRALTDGKYDPEEGEDVWCYTFTWIDEDGEAVDASVFCQNIAADENFVYGVHDNSMLPCIEYDFYPEEHSDKLAFALNNNVFISSYQYDGGTFYGIYGNHFGSSCYSNTFGNSCYNNTFGNECSNNTFGNSCYNNTFGNNCSINTFGNECNRNTFGNNCYHNAFGNNALRCSIGDGVQNITVSKDFIRYVIIENGNQNITITSNKTTSLSAYLQNFLIALGVNNSNNTKTISHTTTNDTFKTTYQNANSDLVVVY